MNTLPRGLRNNNPLNIRHSANKWQGKAAEQNDPSFVTFRTRQYGYRAALITIRTYMTRYNKHTLPDIIKRWAPPSENNTTAYIRRVSEISGLSQFVNIWFSSKEDMINLVYAMAVVENGNAYKDLIKKEEIAEAYSMI